MLTDFVFKILLTLMKNISLKRKVQIEFCKRDYYITIFASGPEREIQQFDWFLRSLELAFRTVDSGNKSVMEYVSNGIRWPINSELRFGDIHRVRMLLEISQAFI